MKNLMQVVAILCLIPFASPCAAATASENAAVAAPMAWVGEYRVRNAQGERAMTLIKDATRVEYRVQGLPVRVWRQVSDGVELQELHPEHGERVTYAPGDLRARGIEPAWDHIASIVDPALRDQLGASRDGHALGEVVRKYRGMDAQKHRIELDWLTGAAMPARYRIEANAASETIELRSARWLPVEQAFTPTNKLRETDGADLGD